MNFLVAGRQWLRVAMPAEWLCALIAGGYLILNILSKLWDGALADDSRFTGVILISSVIYGSMRLTWSHPLCDDDYINWLLQTPWRPGQPLPRGPALPVIQDAAIIAMLCLLAPSTVLGRFAPFIGAAIGYGIRSAVLAAISGNLWFSFGMLFALGAALLFWQSTVVWLIFGIVVVALATGAIRASLSEYPWDAGQRRVACTLAIRENACPHDTRSVGWPFDQLSAGPPVWSLGRSEALALSAVIGWLVFAGSIIAMELAQLLTVAIMVVAITTRVVRYLSGGCRPSISILGYLLIGTKRTSPFLIAIALPVFLSILPFALAVFFISGLQPSHAPPIFGAAVAAALAILWVMGPDYETWRLATPLRIVPELKKQHYIEC